MGETQTCGHRYLSSKKTVDDRALSHSVTERLRLEIAGLGDRRLRVLEIGAGLGTMVTRLADWRVIERAHWRLVDVDADLLREARGWLRSWAGDRGLAATDQGADLRIEGAGIDLTVTFQPAELGRLLGEGRQRAAMADPADLIIANAFLDLVDVAAVLPLLFELAAPDGLFYFSVNFDGETIFLPEHPDDERFMTAYHRSMDERVRFGRPAGESKSGRRLFAHLRAVGADLLAAGSSDWVVFPVAGGYQADEAFFLQSILDFVAEALAARPEVERAALDSWLSLRRRQVERGELIYLAHQLDFFGRGPGGRSRREPATIAGGAR